MSDLSAGAIGLGIKTGAIAVVLTTIVSLMAVVVGFTIVPLEQGKEGRDAARRLGGGVASSFTVGVLSALYAIEHWPWVVDPWMRLVGEHGQHAKLAAYFLAAMPFLALAALPGFWLVAIVMRSVQRRADKDISEIAREIKQGAL